MLLNTYLLILDPILIPCIRLFLNLHINLHVYEIQDTLEQGSATCGY